MTQEQHQKSTLHSKDISPALRHEMDTAAYARLCELIRECFEGQGFRGVLGFMHATVTEGNAISDEAEQAGASDEMVRFVTASTLLTSFWPEFAPLGRALSGKPEISSAPEIEAVESLKGILKVAFEIDGLNGTVGVMQGAVSEADKAAKAAEQKGHGLAQAGTEAAEHLISDAFPRIIRALNNVRATQLAS